MLSNNRKLDRDERPRAHSRAAVAICWRTRDGRSVSVMTREAASVDADEPWVASCDDHGEMICCPTKASAAAAARNRDWCSRCRNQE